MTRRLLSPVFPGCLVTIQSPHSGELCVDAAAAEGPHGNPLAPPPSHPSNPLTYLFPTSSCKSLPPPFTSISSSLPILSIFTSTSPPHLASLSSSPTLALSLLHPRSALHDQKGLKIASGIPASIHKQKAGGTSAFAQGHKPTPEFIYFSVTKIHVTQIIFHYKKQ